MDFAVLADHWVKLKESEKKDKYRNFAWELKKKPQKTKTKTKKTNFGTWKWWLYQL